MESKKINQLATNVSPQTSDLTIIGDPTTGVSKKITLLQIANLFATTGTVTSVGVTETGDALTITGSPITTAGTINIGFAGAATQYVRGDGALADFPTSTGGGSSVSYYLNSSVSQGTIGGVAYRQLSKTPIAGAGTDITISANGYVASYITDSNDPALLEVPAGNFNCEFYFSVNSNAHNPYVYAELYKYDGTTFTLLGSSQSIPEYLKNGSTISAYYFAMPIAVASLTITDRLAIRIYVNVDTRVVTLHTENSHLCQVVTTFSNGLTTLNSLTRQTQFFATGTSGTDFNISSSTATHTFNIPSASASNRGLITTGTQTIAGDKTINGNTDFVGNSNFSGYAIFSNAIPTQINYGAKIAKGSVPATFGSDAVNLYSDATTNNIIFRDNLSIAKLIFNNSTQTFTFPAATGTLALTSDLSSYVPYTGATGSVDLGFNSLSGKTFTANGNAGSSGSLHLKQNDTINVAGINYGTIATNTLQQFVFYWENSSFAKRFNLDFSALSALGTAKTFSLPNTSGTIALTSDIPANIITGTGTSGQVTYFNGTSTVVGSSNHFWDATNNRLGIGTSSPTNKLTISNDGNAASALRINDTNANASFLSLSASNSDAAIIANGTAAIPLDIYTGGSFRVRVSATGNVGIGTSSPTALLHLGVANAAVDGTKGVKITNVAGTTVILECGVSSDSFVGTTSASDFSIRTSNSERMRITSGGNVGLGDSGSSNVRLQIKSGGSTSASYAIITRDSANSDLLVIRDDGLIGTGTRALSPYNNTVGVASNVNLDSSGFLGRSTVSSIRYKENINDWDGNGLDTILALKPKTFKYKKSYYNKADIEFLGLIAEDVAEVSPFLADYENEDRTGLVENVRYAFIVVPLIKAIQELSTKVETLEAIINKK